MDTVVVEASVEKVAIWSQLLTSILENRMSSQQRAKNELYGIDPSSENRKYLDQLEYLNQLDNEITILSEMIKNFTPSQWEWTSIC